jgi:putative ABC transport system permease protein
MISIALVTGISTIFASASTSIDRLIDKQVQADLIISGTSGTQSSAVPPAIAPGDLTRIRVLAGVDAVTAEAVEPARFGTLNTPVQAYDDGAAAARILKVDVTSGDFGALGSDRFAVDDGIAGRQHWAVGQTVTAQFAKGGPRQLTVGAIYKAGQPVTGIVVPWAVATTGFRAPTTSQAYVKLKPGASATAVKKQIDAILADSPEVNVLTRAEWVGNVTQIFDVVLTIVQVLLGVAMLIAVLGIVNTLVLSVLERTRELGMLRAIGLRRGQTMRMVTVESVVISLFGAILGIGVGTGLGAAVVHALKDKGFTDLVLPWTLMAGYLVAGAVVGVLAAIVPAVRAARLNVLGAIAYE